MSITVAPGQSFEATSSGAATGLVGTIGVRIMDGVGGEALARTTAGIVESPGGSGIYTASLTAPTIAGTYSVVWDTGGGGPEWAAESLTVTSSAPAGAVPNDGDLTTLGAVRAFMQKEVGEVAQDGLLQALITRSSRLIMRETGREFTPPVDDAERTFVYRGGGMLDLAPYDLRAASAVAIRINGTDQDLVVETDYALRPQPPADGVYRWLELPRSRRLDERIGRAGSAVVSITGDWGFPSVPADVEHACVVTVVIWARRDVSAFSATFNLDEERLERPEALPSAVRAMLRQWRYPVIG